MRGLLRRHGWHPTSFQILDGDYRYWFSEDAVIAYVDTGRALIVAGAPICPPEGIADVAGRFVAGAERRGRAVAFFGVHGCFLGRTGLPAIPIGESLFWDPRAWPDVLRGTSSLRAQLRRGLAKGVRVELLVDRIEPLRPTLEALQSRWLEAQPMAQLAFLSTPASLRDAFTGDRTFLVAWLGRRPVGYLCLSPIHARRGVLVQDWVRDPSAPNGTTDLLLDAAFRWAAHAGLRYASLGLSPLAGVASPWLRVARVVGRPLFDFEGLHAFKARLRPQGSEPAFLALAGASPAALIIESLRVFAGGSLAIFGAATLRKHLPPLGLANLISGSSRLRPSDPS